MAARRRSVPLARRARRAPRGRSGAVVRRADGVRATPLVRVGLGVDVHPLKPGRRLVLGGVEISHPRGLAGHSDADVLSHAVCDALLGAAGLDDMGVRFPAGDARYLGRSSLWFLEDAMHEIRSMGFRIVNVDAVLLAEAPRLQPHLGAMRTELARALGVEVGSISVKAKRLEGLGALGRQEGIAAHAVALLAGAAL